mmetsp:Transcript_17970/g.56993  ORF Transcript_17970/g.56993 Transcript_17970/m.56993 type:complete len:565 (+) Transcript_17970:73-1767(+)
MLRALLLVLLLNLSSAQHYCWPCASNHGVVGKYTYAASAPTTCYNWYMKYLNNIVPGSNNTGSGWKNIDVSGVNMTVSNEDPPNVMAVELNECGTTLGNAGVNITPMTPGLQELVNAGERLPTGQMHQCPCAVQGRSNIIHASMNRSLADYDAVEAEWGTAYTDRVRNFPSANSGEHVFGVHGVFCAYHSSGPCLLQDIERGVARSWAGNFSRGYTPLMDNNLMFKVQTLGPLLDAFLQDGVEFYPMRWMAKRASGEEPVEMYSVLASPCGKVLIEVTANNTGGRPREHFHPMHHARAALVEWNQPADEILQPLMPLRFSRAIPASKIDEVLEFYGVGDSSAARVHAGALGFQTRVLADEHDASGVRAVTLMLSPAAKMHLQLWVRPEEEPRSGPTLPSAQDFAEARAGVQVGEVPPVVQGFCSAGDWTVSRYVSYQLQLHESVMTPVPEDPNTDEPPVGEAQDTLIDDHFSWDCAAPSCNVAEAGKALYRAGSRIQWTEAASRGFPTWGIYSYDPAGYGIQLHWTNTPANYRPQGEEPPICFDAQQDGTCPGANPLNRRPVHV